MFPAAFSPLSELLKTVAQPSVADANVIRSVKNISKKAFSLMNEEWEAITSQTLQAPDDAANETSSEAR